MDTREKMKQEALDGIFDTIKRLVEARKEQHRFPPCITVRELADELTYLQRHEVEVVVNRLSDDGRVFLMESINDRTIYLNDEKGRT